MSDGPIIRENGLSLDIANIFDPAHKRYNDRLILVDEIRRPVELERMDGLLIAQHVEYVVGHKTGIFDPNALAAFMRTVFPVDFSCFRPYRYSGEGEDVVVRGYGYSDERVGSQTTHVANTIWDRDIRDELDGQKGSIVATVTESVPIVRRHWLLLFPNEAVAKAHLDKSLYASDLTGTFTRSKMYEIAGIPDPSA